jgi:hypothetical protein
MDQIAAQLPANDGIASFNHLYETTTQNMDRAIRDGQFEDAAFMTEFTVHFAGFYFAAVSSYLNGPGQPPKAWLALFEKRGRAADFRPVQFAAAGMDAHIGRDLPVVLSELFAGEASFPSKDSSRHRDYLVVNQVLADTFDQLRDELLDGPLWFKLLGATTALPWIRAMRDKAWIDGGALWDLRNYPLTQDLYLDALDSATRAEAASGFLIHL